MRKTSLLLTLSLVLALAAGCRPYVPATPPGFVDFSEKYEDRDGHEYRATTADGMVLGVRAFDNEPKGEIAFWIRAIENKMRDTSGYALLQTRDVKDLDGNPGKQLRFGHDESGVPHLYYVTVFTNDKRVFLLEAGGTKDLVEKHADQVEWAITNFHQK
jgi:hypothetical protein